MGGYSEKGFQIRTVGAGHRLDGMSDLLSRADGASVLDIGADRGRVTYEFERYGAVTIHGCDQNAEGMRTANDFMAALTRAKDIRFEVLDLAGGGAAIERAFGSALLKRYDFILYLAIHHKLERIMDKKSLESFIEWLIDRCGQYFVLRGSERMIDELDPLFERHKFRMGHWSALSVVDCECNEGKPMPQPCAVWLRNWHEPWP